METVDTLATTLRGAVDTHKTANDNLAWNKSQIAIHVSKKAVANGELEMLQKIENPNTDIRRKMLLIEDRVKDADKSISYLEDQDQELQHNVVYSATRLETAKTEYSLARKGADSVVTQADIDFLSSTSRVKLDYGTKKKYIDRLGMDTFNSLCPLA